MKKLSLFLLVTLFVLPAIAQKEHLKFMGIPLNGTITQFQNKLAAKGIKVDSKLNKNLQAGCRAFTGIFSGEKAQIFVYYNNTTKVVYRAKAVIEYSNGQRGEDKLSEYKSLLKTKYPTGIGTDSEQDGHPSYSLILRDEDFNRLGLIGLYITNSGYSFIETVGLHIDYEDYLNVLANESKKMDDL